MIGTRLVVAALLLASLEGVAAAAEPETEHTSPHAHKILAALDSLGVNDNDVKQWITETDAKSGDGYINLAEEHVPGGVLQFHFVTSTEAAAAADSRNSHRFELRYAPADSHFDVTARQNGAMIGYRWKFN